MSDIVPLLDGETVSAHPIVIRVNDSGTNHNVKIQSSETVGDLFRLVSQQTNIEINEFTLSLVNDDSNASLTAADYDLLLSEVFKANREDVLLHRTSNSRDENASAAADVDVNRNNQNNRNYVNNSATQTASASSNYNNSSYWSNSSSSSSSYYNFKQSTKYRGLSNQGATCYMNSLLQSLFMTPEFRYGLYNWELPTDIISDRTVRSDSIPFQLQKLFAELQSNKSQRAMETKDLTKSFGWGSGDAFTQHDVQELCRLLFDSLENAFSGTSQSQLIQDLYQGELLDYVECKKCRNRSNKMDKFLDIPVTIRQFGSQVAVGSIEEALAGFVNAETLEGDNQYECGHCKTKTDAVKGLAFTKLPYILTVVLKRFDIDYTTMRRVKLNDRVSFPSVLDMNPYLMETVGDSGGGAAAEIGRTRSSEGEDNMYELYSIMIHSGSAFGGHYYAYIKSFEDNKWFKFNDSSVSEIDEKDIEETYGGSSSYGYAYQSSANAYMLLYRRIEKSRNMPTVKDDAIPPILQTLMEEEAKEEEIQRGVKQKEIDSYTINLEHEGNFFQIPVAKTTQISELLTLCLAKIDRADFNRDFVRLRRWLPTAEVMKEALDPEKTVFQSFQSKYDCHVALEFREEGVEFGVAPEGAVVLKVIVIRDLENVIFEPEAIIHMPKTNNTQSLLDFIATHFTIPRDSLKLFRNSYSAALELIRQIDIIYPQDGNQFLAIQHTGLLATDYQQSAWYKEVVSVSSNVPIIFTDIDSPNFSHRLQFNVNSTLLDLKSKMADIVGRPADSFRVFREIYDRSTELQSINSSLKVNGIYVSSGRQKITLHSPKAAVSDFKIHLLHGDRANGRFDEKNKVVEDLFVISLDENASVLSAKTNILTKLKESEKYAETTESNIRLFDFSNGNCSRLLTDTSFLSDSHRYYKNLAMQILPAGAVDTRKPKEKIIEFQRFHASTFSLGPRHEKTLADDALCTDFFPAFSEEVGIPQENLEFVRVAPPYSGWGLLDIGSYRFVSVDSIYTRVSYVLSIYNDLSIVYYRDRTETLKKLSPEENTELEKEAKKWKAGGDSGGYVYKEKKLTIKGGGPKIAGTSPSKTKAEGETEETPEGETVEA